MTIQLSTRGIIEALSSAFLFALIPFFFIPLHRAGITPESGGFYRAGFACLLSLGLVLWHKRSLRLSRQQLASLFTASCSYSVVAIAFFTSLTLMPSGIAATLLFTNPLIVMFFMFILYKEKIETIKLILCLFTCFGIATMSGFFTDQSLITLKGFAWSMLAALGFATYVVSVSRAKKHAIPNDVLSFYLFLVSSICLLIYAFVQEKFMLPQSGSEIFSLFFLALCTAFLSNLLLIMAIAKIGSTLSAILGTLEPVIAVLIGIFLFHEPATWPVLSGISITIVCVALTTIIKREKPLKQ